LGFVWDVLEEAWEEGFRKLVQFKEAEGHCRVPRRFKLDVGLVTWVGTQRSKIESLSTERKQRLDDLGFVWDVLEEAWEEGFSKLVQFKEAEGHCRVLEGFKLDGVGLGSWIRTQRANKENLSTERKQRLDDLGFAWDPYAEAWEEGFSKLVQFKEAEGHCRVPHGFKLDGISLGNWVGNQRTKIESLSTERKQRLDDLGFVWDVLEEAWEQGFRKLVQFKEAEGHCRVPHGFKLDGYNLGGTWVGAQRANKENLSTERKQRLDDLGFVWDPYAEAWEEGFRKLVQFKEAEGHCRVPHGFKLDGISLGNWIRTQRANKENLSTERKQLLDDLGFAWDASKDRTQL
jgi:hypothetical protein